MGSAIRHARDCEVDFPDKEFAKPASHTSSLLVLPVGDLLLEAPAARMQARMGLNGGYGLLLLYHWLVMSHKPRHGDAAVARPRIHLVPISAVSEYFASP